MHKCKLIPNRFDKDIHLGHYTTHMSVTIEIEKLVMLQHFCVWQTKMNVGHFLFAFPR